MTKVVSLVIHFPQENLAFNPSTEEMSDLREEAGLCYSTFHVLCQPVDASTCESASLEDSCFARGIQGGH